MSSTSPVVVDLRSDTVTTPTLEMREAMMNAVVGDDVLGDDPTAIKLQERAAEVFGMEAALFVPTGTMGNLICVMTHCNRRGDEVVVGDKSHISLYEQGGVAQLGGVHPRTVQNLPNGTLDLTELKSKLMLFNDAHLTTTKLVCIENTHNGVGGRVIPPSYMEKLAQLLKGTGVKVHVDGARIFNAATALNLPVSSLLTHADSVSVCLSKGLGAPVGSVIAGKKDFIERTHRLRKVLGGGMRQVGVLAAPGLIALDKMSLRLQVDHDNARVLSAGLASLSHLGVESDVDSVETNIVLFQLNRDDMSASRLVKELEMTQKVGLADHNDVMSVSVKVLTLNEHCVRAVVHHQVNRKGVELALAKLRAILEK